MGNSNEKKDFHKLDIKFSEKQKILEKTKIENEIKKIEEERKDKIKYELSIYIYSNHGIEKNFTDFLSNNNEIYDWKIKTINGNFSNKNSNELIQNFKEDFENNNFKNVIIIPINSILDFKKEIEIDEQNILNHFDKSLIIEEQPFFLFIDYEENDFIKTEDIGSVSIGEDPKGNFCIVGENKIIDFEKYLKLRREEIDFEIFVEFKFKKNQTDNINLFKELIINKEKNLDDFKIEINENNLYSKILGIENTKLEIFLRIFEDESIDCFNVSFLSISQNGRARDEFVIYEELKDSIREKKFILYELQKDKINDILKEYQKLDQRNFNIIRKSKSPKYQLIKYTGYYNQFGDILFSEKTSYYPAKINIAVGGFIGSGKSTLINTLLGEKRCLEGQGSSITNYISQYTLKDYPINLIDFPGFRARQGDIDNTTLFIKNIKNKMEEMKQINEFIHCFLFCIKFEERIFDIGDKEMKNLFDTLFKLQIKTFFIITQSEKEDTDEFQRFKKNLLKSIKNVEKDYKNKDLVNKLFGENIENQIIPIFCFKKKKYGHIVNPFGLDNLFNSLYEYFESKKIKCNYELFEKIIKNYDNNKDDKDILIQETIKNNELLRVFGSKEKFLEGMREKIKKECIKFILKSFLFFPRFIYSKLDEILYIIINEMIDRSIIIYQFSMDKKNNIDRMVKQMFEEEFGTIYEATKEIRKDEIQKKLPLALRILFPIISPIYYLLGTPILLIFINKLSNSLSNLLLEKDDKQFLKYFLFIMRTFDTAIDNLKDINITFKNQYKIINK